MNAFWKVLATVGIKVAQVGATVTTWAATHPDQVKELETVVLAVTNAAQQKK